MGIPGGSVQQGIFRVTATEDGYSESSTEDCGTSSDLGDACSQKLTAYCYLLKALTVLGLLASAAAVSASLVKPSSPKLSRAFILFAAACYYVAIVVLIDEVVGSSKSHTSTCGFADNPYGGSPKLSAGFGLLVVSFV